MILVTGSAGKTGHAILKALLARDKSVRGFVRRQEQADVFKQLGAVDLFVGDMRKAEDVWLAAQGVEAIYHICPNMSPDEVEIGRLVIDAARQAGVKHFVYHSVLHPQVMAMPHHWHKMQVEEIIFSSKLNFTILQPSAYMQNILGGWKMIVDQGIYSVPYAIEARIGIVDLEDVAETAATILSNSEHFGATYELVGPENLSANEVTTIISRQLGRSVKAEQIPIDTWRQQTEHAGISPEQIEMLVKMFLYYDQYGFIGSSWILEQLLKRPATDLSTFISRHIQTANFIE